MTLVTYPSRILKIGVEWAIIVTTVEFVKSYKVFDFSSVNQRE